MELKLTNGRYSVSEGTMETVNGQNELAQRIVMKLQSRRGSFPLLPDYGSQLYLLHKVKESEREVAAKQYAAQALEDEKNITVEDVAVTEIEDGVFDLNVELQYNGDLLTVTARV